MLLLLLAPSVAEPPVIQTVEPPRGGGPVLYPRRRLEEVERREEERRAVERAISETIRAAWQKANGEEREEIAAAVELPEKPKADDFKAVARSVVSDDGIYRIERLAAIERLLTEYTARKNAERHAQAVAWVEAAIAAAIEADEDDIEALLVA